MSAHSSGLVHESNVLRMQYLGYARVSTEEQGESGAGLEAQRTAIRAECERRGWTLVGIEEDVLSAKSLKRPGLQRVLEACRSGEIQGIVVSRLDRFSRSVIDFARLLAEAQRDGWNIVGLDFGVDLASAQGKLVAHVLMAVAQWEREIIGVRTRDALVIKRAQGVRLGRPPALSDEIRLRIRDARASGLTFAQIAAALNDDGVPTAHGGSRWYPSTVHGAARAAGTAATN